MWVVVNYYPSTSARFVYYIKNEMCKRLSCLAGCVRILRHMSVVSTRAISTRFLPRANTASPPNNLLDIILVPGHFINQTLKRRHVAANLSHFVTNGLTPPLVLQFGESKL